jgi:hypothetical protein
MRKLTMGAAAALTLLSATGAFAQASGSGSAGSAGDPPNKVWIYTQSGWVQRDVGEPQRGMLRGGQRVERPMIYWQSGNTWYAMPDRKGESGFISDDLSKATPGGASK